jgi:acyl-CoA synthetase (AMP-forming)/AMP-acid ligase II
MRRGDELRVADVIRDRAACRGDAIALRHRERELTYVELDERSRCRARALLARGVGHGTRVANLDRAAPEVVELLFAVSKIGGVIVPLNWRLAAREQSVILADSQARVLIAGGAFEPLAEQLVAAQSPAPELIVVGEDEIRGYERLLSDHEPHDPGGRGERGDVIVQLYTSGTTGVPKEVLTTHRNLCSGSPRPPRAGSSTRARSASPRSRCSTSAASGGRSWALWNGATRSWSAISIRSACSTRSTIGASPTRCSCRRCCRC